MSRGSKSRSFERRRNKTIPTHHHADVLLHLVVDGAVEHDVHELVEAAERARDGAVGVEGDCFFFLLLLFVVEVQKRMRDEIKGRNKIVFVLS